MTSDVRRATDFVVVSTAVDGEATARALAAKIVEKRLAACVQHTAISSTYRWKGAIETADEYLLLCKTRASLADALTEFIRRQHSYEIAEVLVTAVEDGITDYLEWIYVETEQECLCENEEG